MDALSTLADAALATVTAAAERLNLGSEAHDPMNASLKPASSDVGVILQSLCHLHRYVRTSSDLHIYEKPERLRSIRLGLAIAHGRLSEASQVGHSEQVAQAGVAPAATATTKADDAIEDLLSSLTLGSAASQSATDILHTGSPFSITSTSRRLKLSDPIAAAITLAHGDDYIPQLCTYLRDTASKLVAHESEVPNSLSQGDLYLCDTSLQALEGALGACCHAIDEICVQGRTNVRRFVSIRPPGHHCETEQPMGFCWLNNVAVAAAHGETRLVMCSISADELF